MIKKRNRFWTIVFALLPGAGHMYNGFMKLGVSLMGLFFAVWAFAAFVNIGAIGILTPIIWFYAFFDCINRTFLEEEDFYSQEDHYLFNLEILGSPTSEFITNHRVGIGIGFIIIGLFAIWDNLCMKFIINLFVHSAYMQEMIYTINYLIPQLVVAILIVWVGITLIKGKKNELKMVENESIEE